MLLPVLALALTATAATPEERALRALLEDRPQVAVRLLEAASEEDELLRWFAGRVALQAGDLRTARRLLDGDRPADRWGQVDLLVAEGRTDEAARLALAEMGTALQGEHRDALARMLIDQAQARAEREPSSASRILRAVLELEASEALDREAEDGLFALVTPGQPPPQPLVAAALRRLEGAAEAEELPARLVAGMARADARPLRAHHHLALVIQHGERDLALKAARSLAQAPLPPPLRLQALDDLAERFVRDEEIARLRLELATHLSRYDETATAALAGLEEDPFVGPEAAEARAMATSDLGARRALWLALAEREGRSARGDRARAQATAALVAAVLALPEGEVRRQAAAQALQTPDGQALPVLLHAALGEEDRLEARWDLAERFPEGGPWCPELAEELVRTAAGEDEAARFTAACPHPTTPQEQALHVLGGAWGEGETFLSLLTGSGQLIATTTGAERLQVAQNRVDPEVLFRSSWGNPLDTPLDAFLVAPDQGWEVPVEPGRVQEQPVTPRGAGVLHALTVRSGDRRATALVPRRLLEVQAARGGEQLALAVLHEGRPVRGASLLIIDDDGKEREARTDRHGVALVDGVEGWVRIMARSGDGIGFAEVDPAPGAPTPEARLTLVLEDRWAPQDGGRVQARVFLAAPGEGDGEGAVTLRAETSNGQLLEERTLRLQGGTAGTELFVQGGGRVVARRDDEVIHTLRVASAAPDFPLAVTFWPPQPRPGDTLEIRVASRQPLPPDGLEAQLRLRTPWLSHEEELLLQGEPVRLQVSLAEAAPGEEVQVELRLAGGARARAGVLVTREARPEMPEVPPLVAVGGSLGSADTWRVARHQEGSTTLWAAPGEALRLPAKVLEGGSDPTPATGLWEVRSWVEGVEGPAASVLAVALEGPLATEGTWNGEPTLQVRFGSDFQATLLLPGQSLAPPSPAAWTTLGAGLALPPAPRPLPALQVEGTLRRGEAAELSLAPDLPQGSRLYAVLRDASDARRPAGAQEMQQREPAPAGGTSEPWSPQPHESEEVLAALLAEEERLREQAATQRVALDARRATQERARSVGGLGTRGAGHGGAGFGTGAGHGVGRAGFADPRPAPDLPAAPGALAVLEAGAPGGWSVTVPGWVTAAELDLVVRLPDGTWVREIRRVGVDGPSPGALPAPAPEPAPETWDGSLSTLVAVARTLPVDARLHALAALQDQAAARPALVATQVLGDTGVGRSLATLRGGEVPAAAAALRRLEGLPDPRRVERSLAALEAAAGAPDLAASAARRLLREPDLHPYVRARAGLALRVAGHPDEALRALQGEGALLAAARVVAGGALTAEDAPALWAVARDEAADPHDRALALQALATRSGRPVAPVREAPAPTALPVQVGPPLAALRGQEFSRGARVIGQRPSVLDAVSAVPAGRTVPVTFSVPPQPAPTRVRCPDDEVFQARATWLSVAARPTATEVTCLVRPTREGAATLTLTLHRHDGTVLGQGQTELQVEPARPADPGDPMSPDERHALGVALASRGLPGAQGLLRPLLAEDTLSARAVVQVSEALLEDARREGEGAALVAAFEAARERSRQSALDLQTAAAVAEAYAATGEPGRAVAAARAVVDARFREELAAVRSVHEGGLAFVALLLLQELKVRYPEGAAVIQARYLAPSLLLERATGDQDRLGYTRASLRHSAAADLARFLLLHPSDDSAPDAAVLLGETLRQLRDPAREQALAGPLVRRYGETPNGWRLAIVDARARFATGDLAGAARALDGVEVEGPAAAQVALELGRIAEARGRVEEAIERYEASGVPEAHQRAAWLKRAELDPPSVLVLHPDDRAVVPASLAPGTRVDLSATRIALENLLLRDGGTLDPSAAVVDGLAAERTLIVRAGPTGELPLPRLGAGAWLVTATLEGEPRRFLVLRGDLQVEVREGPNGNALVQVRDQRGRPVQGAQLWVFGSETRTATTDALGAAWMPGAQGSPVLARLGPSYAWHEATRTRHAPRRAPARQVIDFDDDVIEGMLQKNVSAYESMFRQERTQTLSTDAF